MALDVPAALVGGAAEPFLKWAGGKRRLAPLLRQWMPSEFARYHEPFLGGGALYFAMQPDSAVLSDVNEDLINCYLVVRDDVEALIADLARHRHERAYFLELRRQMPTSLTQLQAASRFIYLNRTAYNGLYRVNQRGQFNVPFGDYRNPSLRPIATLRAASAALQGARLQAVDFRKAVECAGPSDFVYLDPPYIPVGPNSDFRRYHRDQFRDPEQVALADTFEELANRGCYVMLSNSNTPRSMELFGRWRVRLVQSPRAISSRPETRGPVSEIVVTNY